MWAILGERCPLPSCGPPPRRPLGKLVVCAAGGDWPAVKELVGQGVHVNTQDPDSGSRLAAPRGPSVTAAPG